MDFTSFVRLRSALLFCACAIALGACGGSSSEPSNYVAEGEPLPVPATEIAEMVDYVAEQSGREWKRPPVIVGQNDDDYAAGRQPDADLARLTEERSAIEARRMQALGLFDGSASELLDMITTFTTSSDGILAYYLPEEDRIFIPVETDRLDMLRGILVHELVHALDGQYEDLGAIIESLRNNPGADLSGRTAVIEGRAQSLQNAWMATVGVPPSPDELADAAAELPPLPQSLLLGAQLPYVRGAEFIDAQGGIAETWDLYANPPTSSEQYLFPDRYPDDQPADVAIPDADGPIIETYEVGSTDLFTWLVGTVPLTPEVAAEVGDAVEGLGGGSAVLWGDDRETCYRAVLTADTPEDGMELFALFDGWSQQGESRTVEVMADRMIITGCAPLVP